MSRLLPILAAVFLSLPAQAVDNSTHKVALGAVGDFAGLIGPAQISVKLPLTPRWELSFLLGFNFASTSEFAPAVKGWYVLLPEKNLNFYLAGSAGLDFLAPGGFRAFLFRAGPGVELFATEWPNVGFMVEFGVASAIVNGPGDSFGTSSATGFGTAGIHYYF